MQTIGEYIIKLSIGLSIVCVFYQLVLKRLTFYTWNRFYFLCYSAVCFLIPFIDVTPALQRSAMDSNMVVQLIPALQPLTNNVVNTVPITTKSLMQDWNTLHWLLLVMLAGTIVLLVRLVVRLISFRRILHHAELISEDGAKVYQVDRDVIPFSFGNSIFVNNKMHDESELKEIILHEFVHVKQKHTIDILWAEMLCILNWYNPFAWWLRSLIKQNLEFIADNKVIEGGIDKKEYQYLLLKVMGNKYYAIANSFNFSSLKKRILMMNKFKNTRVHLLKFFFIFPLMTVVLLSFRHHDRRVGKNKIFKITGIVVDHESLQPLADVTITDAVSGIHAVSDKGGYYLLQIPVTALDTMRVRLKCKKTGYQGGNNLGVVVMPWPVDPDDNDVIFLSISRNKDWGGLHAYGRARINGKTVAPDFTYVSKKFKDFLNSKKIDSTIGNAPQPVRIIDGIPYIFSNSGMAWFSREEVDGSAECKVWVEGKMMSIEKANASINRFMYDNVGAIPRASAKELLNVDCNVLLLFKDSVPPTQKKPKVSDNKKITPGVAHTPPANEIINIVADGFTWKNNSLEFNGEVSGTFVKGKDTVRSKSTSLILPADKSIYLLFNHKRYTYGNTYTAQSGESFNVYVSSGKDDSQKQNAYADNRTIQINSATN
jgi:beta-lactamase regulating signal transducer with metallopeptidase domain